MTRLQSGLVVLALAAPLGCGTVARVEEPKFAVELHDEEFDVRTYAPRVVAETRVSGRRKDADSEGFRRLAGYIFGGNEQRAKIAMTAPVGLRAEGRKIAMTAPVGLRAEGDSWTVSFTMPEGETLATLPQPKDARVTLRELPAARVGVVRFSGRWTEASFAEHAESLRAWLSARGLSAATAEPEVNRYDPPWTPWFMRRNEVWLSVKEPGPGG